MADGSSKGIHQTRSDLFSRVLFSFWHPLLSDMLFPCKSPSPRPDPHPDPTQHPETDPKRTRNRPGTAPTEPKRTRNRPKWTEIKVSGVGRPWGLEGKKIITAFVGHPSSSPFLGTFAPFSPPQKALLVCRVKGAGQSLERGSSRMNLSTKFGKEIPSRNLREKGSETLQAEIEGKFSPGVVFAKGSRFLLGSLLGVPLTRCATTLNPKAGPVLQR